MPKKLIRRYLPDPHSVRESKHLKMFGTLLHDANLWHLNRRSVSWAMAIGLFAAFLPMPLQTIPAAAAAIFFRANLPIACALCWLSNPLTFPLVTYSAYKIGSWLLLQPPKEFEFVLSWDWFVAEFTDLMPPFLLGSFTLCLVLAVLGYYLTRMLWRLSVILTWRARARRPARV